MAHGIQIKNFQNPLSNIKAMSMNSGKYLLVNATTEKKSVTCVEINGNNGSTINL